MQKWDDYRLHVRSVKRESDAEGDWSYVSRKWITGPGQPQSVRRYLGLEPDEWPVVVKDGVPVVFHFGGARRKAVLDLVLGEAGAASAKVTPWQLSLASGGAEKPEALSASVAHVLAAELSDPELVYELEKTLGRPYANARLPDEDRAREIAGWLRLEDEVAAINRARWVEPTNAAADALALLVKDLR